MSGVTTTNVEYGDPNVARPNEILRTVVGSGVHGIAIEGTDDHDEMGVFVEPPEHVVGLLPAQDHYIWRTQPEGARSGPGDTDLVMYSLRRYLRLAIKGNPTALLPLYAPESAVITATELGHELRALAGEFLSQEAVERFLGYMNSQRERMMGGGRQGRVPNRPELIERYGWDVKYGSHALRLAHQGLEVAEHGRLTLPLPDHIRDRVLSVKRGEVEREAVNVEILSLEAEVQRILEDGSSPLPRRPHVERLSAWAMDAQRRHWGWSS